MPSSACRSISRFTTCACTETSSAETGSSQTISFGLQRQRAGDAEALPLAAGELVRILGRRLGAQADAGEQPLHPLAPLGAGHAGEVAQRLGDDLAGRQARVERGVRVLEDDLQVLPALAHAARPTASVSSSPSSFTEPEVGSTRRSTDFAVVVLPQPDSPTSASVSPRSTVKETSSTAWIGGRALPSQRLGREVVLAQVLDGEQGRSSARSVGACGAASAASRQCSGMRPSSTAKQATPWPAPSTVKRRLLDRGSASSA